MKRILLILLAALGLCFSSFGQTTPSQLWVQTYGGTDSTSSSPTAVDANGNVIVAGYTLIPLQGANYTVIKYDSSGTRLWVQTYNGPANGNDKITALAVDNHGNIYVTGSSSTTNSGLDYVTIMYDPNGNQNWVSSFNGAGNGDDIPSGIAVDANGNVYVTGSTTGDSTGTDYGTIKYNSTGVQQWVNIYNGSAALSADAAAGIALTSTGVFVTGGSTSLTGGLNALTQRIDMVTGAQLWAASFDGSASGQDQANAITTDASGNVYLTGSTQISGPNTDYLTIQYNSTGVQQWVATHDGHGLADVASALVVDQAGNLVVTGLSTAIHSYEYHTIKYNSTGVQQWVAISSIGSLPYKVGRSIGVDAQNNISICGSNAVGKKTYMDLLNYTSAGALQWSKSYTGPQFSAQATDLSVDHSGSVYLIGQSNAGAVFTITTIKFGQSPSPVQPNATCVSAQTLSAPYSPTNSMLYGPLAWYSFVASTSQEEIIVRNQNLPCNINRINVYQGSCSNLTLISSTIVTNSPQDSLLVASVTVIPGTTYYFQVQRDSTQLTCTGGSLAFNVSILNVEAASSCTAPLVTCDYVTNGNFETYDYCPTQIIASAPSQYPASCWYDPSVLFFSAGVPQAVATPDYFNSCATGNSTMCNLNPTSCAGVPYNYQTSIPVADHTPGTGGIGGYGGFYAYFNNHNDDTYHEYIQEQLRSPLIAGNTYNISFWVQLSNTSLYSVPQIGLYVHTGVDPQGDPSNINTATYVLLQANGGGSITPQAYSSAPILASSGWFQITGTYTATGGEDHITVGNFNQDLPSTVVNNPGGLSTNPCAYYFVDDVSIVPVLKVSVTNDGPICLGCPNGPDNLFAQVTGGATPYTYSWVPGSGLYPTNGIGNPVFACPGLTTTYTVNVTDAIGCTQSASTTVIVNQPPAGLTITSSAANPVCLTTTLTASSTGTGTLTYSWSPATGLNTTTGPVVIATPTQNTTYTVTATNASGCISTATISVVMSTNQCCQPLTIAEITAPLNIVVGNNSAPAPFNNPNGIVNGIYEIGPGITVTVPPGLTYIFDGCTFRMDAGSSIVVTPGATLSIENKAHLYSCTGMWNGIYLDKSSTLNVISNAWIEDALIAIEANGGGVYHIKNAIFNRNHIHIQVDKIGVSPNSLAASVLTCREIPILPTPVEGIVAAGLTNYPTAFLQNGTPNARTEIGVYANNVVALNIGTAVSGNGNIFDNMDYGVWLNQSGATIVNNTFQYMQGKGPIATNPQQYTGIGVFGVLITPTSAQIPIVQVGGTGTAQPNTFLECLRGIDLNGDYESIAVENNTLQVNQTSLAYPFGKSVGAMGIYVSPGLTNAVTVSNNSIVNFNDGTYLSRRPTGTAPSVSFTNNTVSVTAAPSFCTNAMTFSDPAFVAPNMSFLVDNNVITGAKNGILVQSMSGNSAYSRYVFSNNGCQTVYQTTGNGEGMQFLNCRYVEAVTNHVHGDPQAALPGGNINLYGIHLLNSPSMFIHCNDIDHEGRDMVFEGNCLSIAYHTQGVSTGAGILQNTMSYAQDGFVLKTNGIIGTQGIPEHTAGHPLGIPSDNYWDMIGGVMGTFSRSETYTDFTRNTNTLSVLFNSGISTSNIQATKPLINGTNSGAGNQYITGLPISIGAIIACGLVPHSAISNTSVDSLISLELQTTVEDTCILPVWSNETHFIRTQNVYDMLINDNSLFKGNRCLSNFYLTGSKGNAQKFNDIETDIAMGQYNDARTDNNAIQPQNQIETYQKNFNNLYLRWLQNPNTLDSTQIEGIEAIAFLCPLESGNSVFQARSLLDLWSGIVAPFTENCDTSNSSIGHTMVKISEGVDTINYNIKIYPNPNNGNMTLEYSLIEGEKGEIIITDINGKEVFRSLMLENGTSMLIHSSQLCDGIYSYRIEMNGQLRKTGKLIIIQ